MFFVRLNNRFHRALKNHFIKPVLRQNKTTGKQHLVIRWLSITFINIKSIKVKSVQDLAEICDHTDGNNHIRAAFQERLSHAQDGDLGAS